MKPYEEVFMTGKLDPKLKKLLDTWRALIEVTISIERWSLLPNALNNYERLAKQIPSPFKG